MADPAIDLADLMRASSAEEEPGPPARPDMDAQRLELLDRWASYKLEQPVRPGDLVVEKEGLSVFKPHIRPTHALILWRLLDFSKPYDCEMRGHFMREMGLLDADCLVAWISDSGESVAIAPRCLAALRPLTHAERASLDRMLAPSDAEGAP